MTNETADMSTPPTEDRVPVTFRTDTGTGKPEITVRGERVEHLLTGIQIISDRVVGTRIAVEVAPHRLGAVEFSGLAVVELNTYSEDPGPAAATFLAAMDPKTLEKAALNRIDLGNEEAATTAAILRTLIEWANGEGTL